MRQRMSPEERENLKERIKKMVLTNQGAVSKQMAVERFHMAGRILLRQAAAELVGHPDLPGWRGWPTTQYVQRGEIDPKMAARQRKYNNERRSKDAKSI